MIESVVVVFRLLSVTVCRIENDEPLNRVFAVSSRHRSRSAWTRGRRTPPAIAACSVAASAKTMLSRNRLRTATACHPGRPAPSSCPCTSVPTANAPWRRTNGLRRPTKSCWWAPFSLPVYRIPASPAVFSLNVVQTFCKGDQIYWGTNGCLPNVQPEII